MNRCQRDVLNALTADGGWLSRVELDASLDWSAARLDDELAELVMAGSVQFAQRGAMYRLAGDVIARQAVRQLFGDGSNVSLVGRQSSDKATYRIGIARRVNAGQADEAVVMAALEMPYPAEGAPALAQMVATLTRHLAETRRPVEA